MEGKKPKIKINKKIKCGEKIERKRREERVGELRKVVVGIWREKNQKKKKKNEKEKNLGGISAIRRKWREWREWRAQPTNHES